MLKTRTTAKKEEIRRALVVQQVGLRRKAVPNVPRAVRVDLAVGAKIVHWVMPEQETTMMQRNVNNVNWVKRQRLKGQLIVMLAMLGHLVKPTVFVPIARRVSTKTTKVQQNAVTCVPRLAKYPTTKAPGVNCPRGVPAKWVNI